MCCFVGCGWCVVGMVVCRVRFILLVGCVWEDWIFIVVDVAWDGVWKEVVRILFIIGVLI